MNNLNNYINRIGYYLPTGLKQLLSLVFIVMLPLTLLANNGSETKYKKVVVGSDFSLDFVASAPLTYNHTTGGGFYADRTIGRDKDVVESLEGGDFACGDIVTYLTAITVDDGAVGCQTIELDYSWLAASTGQPGVALSEIVYVDVNTGDSGMIDDGNCTADAELKGGGDGTINGTLFEKGATLTGTVIVSGLEAGEVIIVRTDVRIACQFGSSPTGNLQGAISGGSVVVPTNLNRRDATISVGNQTVPFKNVNLIFFPTCAIVGPSPVCGGSENTYTATSDAAGATFVWSITAGNGTIDATTQTTTATGTGGTQSTIEVTAGASGSFTLSVSISAPGYQTQSCPITVNISEVPARPVVTIQEATLCGTLSAPSLTVSCPVVGTYTLTQTGVAGSRTFAYTGINGPVVFANLVAGAGFSITLTVNGCVSAATNCTNYLTYTCPSLGALQESSSSSAIKREVNSGEKNITAYPVPFRDRVNVDFKSERSGNYSINLYDSKGKLVKELKTGKGKVGQLQSIEVDGRNLPDGMYFIRVVDGAGSRTVKLLKKE